MTDIPEDVMIKEGDLVSFFHEGSGLRVYGAVRRVEGDTLTIRDASGRDHKASRQHDPIDLRIR